MKKIFYNWIRSFILLILCSFVYQISFATILEKMDTEKLTKKAQYVIIGTVTDIKSFWHDKKRLILTTVTISIEQRIKGSYVKSEIEIMYLGGRVGSTILEVDGTPTFKTNEKVLVFVEPEIENHFRAVGWFQGKYTIENDQIKEKKKSLNAFVNEIRGFMSKYNMK